MPGDDGAKITGITIFAVSMNDNNNNNDIDNNDAMTISLMMITGLKTKQC